MKTSTFFVLCTCFPFALISQTYGDCATALEICNKDSLHFALSTDVGTNTTELDTTCLSYEHATTWIQWEIQQTGSLTFIITPDELTPSNDIDFAVFKFNNQADCEDKTLVRCMAAGENVGSPFPDWEACSGPTGLDFFETDVLAMGGCPTGTNNFLAALYCQAGERYVLVINNFSGESGYSVEFCGDALLPCDSLICLPLGAEEQKPKSRTVGIVPNPVSYNILTIKAPGISGNIDMEILDSQGRIIIRQRSVQFENDALTLDISTILAGMYFVTLKTPKGILSSKFVRQ